jgi:hypothetical protein
MKCDYCGAEDHLISACRAKSGDRSAEVGSGVLAVILLGLFWILGALAGSIAGAFVRGYKKSNGIWDDAVRRVKGRGDETSTV